MKKFLFLLLWAAVCHAQDGQSDTDFKLNLSYRLGYSLAVPTGNNALNEAYRNTWGFENHIDLLSYRHFRLGFGGNLHGYKVTKREVVGDFSDAVYLNLYGAVSYNYQYTEKWRLTPMIGIGSGDLGHSGPNLKIQAQRGTEFRFGGYADYGLGRHSFVYVGAFFAATSLPVNTTPEYKEFYSRLRQFQVSVGFNFD